MALAMRSASRTCAARSRKAKSAAARCEPAENKGTIAQGPGGQGAHNRVVTHAPAGSAYVGQGALNHDDQAPNIAPALKLALESFAVCADTAGHIACGLSLYHRAFRQGRQDNVASFKSPRSNSQPSGKT